MVIRIAHLFPDLMSLYGGWANAEYLKRAIEAAGTACEIIPVHPEDETLPAGADAFYLGAGTERAALYALERLRPQREALKAALDGGAVGLFCGTGMDLLGTTLQDMDGKQHEGLSLAPFATEQKNKRITEDVLGACPLFPEPIVGFINKCSLHRGITTPLVKDLALGFGNETEGGDEGYHAGTIFASCLTGPILVKNPALLKHIAALILRHAGLERPAEIPVSDRAEQGYAVTVQALRERCGK